MPTSDVIRYYQGMIWTDHVLSRMKLRSLTQDQVVAVMRKPDQTYPGQKPDTVKFIRTLSDRQIHVVAKLTDRQQWLILTVFVRGEEDQWPLPERIIFGTFHLLGRGIWAMARGVVRGAKWLLYRRSS